jgi:ribonuclease HI
MHRNLKLWQDKNESCAQVVDRARHVTEEWLAANSSPRQQHGTTISADVMPSRIVVQQQLLPTSVPGITHLQKPLPGRLKCNIDAVFSTVLNRVGICMCLRDDEDAYMLAKTMSLSPLVSVNVGDALAFYHALQWIRDMGFDNVDFVLDSKTTSDAISSNIIDVTKLGQIIAACQDTLSSSFTNSRVEFNRRQTPGIKEIKNQSRLSRISRIRRKR